MVARKNVLTLWLACLGSLPAMSYAAELPLATQPVIEATSPQLLVLDGEVEAINRATVSAQTSGRITAIYYDVDDFVEKGDIIVSMRDQEQRARYSQAEASLKEAQARFSEARSEFQRNKDIYEQRLISKSRFDQSLAERNAANARFEAARAALQQAQEQLAYTEIRAPYSGIVIERHVEVGETAQPGKPLVTGISLEKLRIATHVPQGMIAAVRKSGKARILREDDPDNSVEASRLIFFPYADSQTNTFKVRMELPEGLEGLFPGMFVKVVFVIGEKQRLMIPQQAVVQRSEVTGVYVVNEDGKVSLRHIRTGRRDSADMVEVHAGLQPGEAVVLDPVRAGVYVKEQQAVAVPHE